MSHLDALNVPECPQALHVPTDRAAIFEALTRLVRVEAQLRMVDLHPDRAVTTGRGPVVLELVEALETEVDAWLYLPPAAPQTPPVNRRHWQRRKDERRQDADRRITPEDPENAEEEAP